MSKETEAGTGAPAAEEAPAKAATEGGIRAQKAPKAEKAGEGSSPKAEKAQKGERPAKGQKGGKKRVCRKCGGDL